MNKRPPRNGEKPNVFFNTLLIDGNALFKVGYYGAKNEYNHRGEHIGGIYQFLTVIRKLLIENVYERVYVFWDGELSGKLRYDVYKHYKIKRGKNYETGTQPIDEDEINQKKSIELYLDNLYIRQLKDKIVESDDFIAYFCNNKKENENITICTNDRDMCQLISEDIKIYFCDLKKYITPENFNENFGYYHKNSVLIKTIIGDVSDSINGIKGVKLKGLLCIFPELSDRELSIEYIIERAKQIQDERVKNKQKKLKVLDNIIYSVTDGIQGNDIYKINTILVSLINPLITESAINNINFLIDGDMESSERNIKNVIEMFKIDGLNRIIGEHRISDYLLPYKQLKEREIKANKQLNN